MNTSFLSRKWTLVGLGIAVLYLSVVCYYATNLPFTDDLAILANIYDFQTAQGWLEKIKTLFSFHNEHRLAIPRLWILLLYYTNGLKVNFIAWIITGNLFIYAILYLYYKSVFQFKQFYYFIPVLLLVLQPMHYELMYWGMASIQNIGVILLITLSLYGLLFNNSLFLSVVLCVLATFTSVNGFLGFFVAVLVCLLDKKWEKSLLFLFVGICVFIGYKIGFTFNQPVVASDQKSFDILLFFKTFFSLIGAIVYTQKMSIVSIGCGLLICVSFLLVLLQKLRDNNYLLSRKDLFLASCICFCMLTVAAISYGRSVETIMLVSRYRMYACLILALLYIFSIDYFLENSRIVDGVIVLCLFFCAFSYYRYLPMFVKHNQLLFSHYFNWKYADKLDIPQVYAQTYYSTRWHAMAKAEYYIVPEEVAAKADLLIKRINTSTLLPIQTVRHNYLVLIGPASLPFGDHYVVARVDDKVAIYPMTTDSYYSHYFSNAQVTYASSVSDSYWISKKVDIASIISF